MQQSRVVKNITSDIAKEIPKIDERPIRLGVFDNWATSLHLLAAMNEHGVKSIELYANLDWHSYYQALFPNLALQVINISREEMQKLIKTGDHLPLKGMSLIWLLKRGACTTLDEPEPFSPAKELTAISN